MTMPRRKTSGLTMEEVQSRFDQWRQTRRAKARIPDELWSAAGELAREHGVNRVSRILRLEFNHLMRLAESYGRAAARKGRALPAFVELIAPPTGVAPTCIIALEGQRGTMRIEWNGTTAD